MAVSKRLRYEILRRDSHTCRYCGASAPDVPLRVDHVTPVALGGSDKPENLATSCEPCNSGKSSATVDSAVVADVDATALRWADAMKQAAENLRQQQTPKGEYRDAFLAEWNRWGRGEGDARTTIELPGDWKPSIERFRVAGLPVEVWEDIVDTAMGYGKVLPVNKFKYCCGIAWNKVTELQAEARRIVGSRSSGSGVAPIPEALAALVVEVWRREAGLDLTAGQETELRAHVIEATETELDEEDILRGIKYAAWYGGLNIDSGLAHAIDAEQAAEVMRWEFAWYAASGEHPSEEQTATYEAHRKALREAGVSEPILGSASAVAGFALSCVPHFGIALTFTEAAGINAKQQMAEDFWALSFAATAARWPTAEERRKFNAQLDRLTDDGGYLTFDANAAAVAAGAAQEADLYWNVPRNFSALLAASKPLAGGEN